MASPPRAGRCNAATMAAVAVAVAVVVVQAAASPVAVPVAAGGAWSAAAAAVKVVVAPPSTFQGGVLPAVVGRPLADGVSVLTNGTYELLNANETRFGCPSSVVIAGPLATDNGTFLIPPASLTVNGGGCTGANSTSAVGGLFGDTLIDAANQTGNLANLTQLLQVDPEAAIARVLDGPITCGEVVFEDAAWTFLVASGLPLLVLTDGVDPSVGCTLADRSVPLPSVPTPAPTSVPTTTRLGVSRGVPAPGGGEPADVPGWEGV